ncbi:MAG: DMT family transporter [Pseudolabrys sp.]|nr:DMT family transporter [Pseudolabrys sp.]MBV9262103.1 DMT family transporter [Pseudolabrys sp.]
MLWAVFTIIAAASQTARNAMQRELTATLGTAGATHVRFLFGFPFAALFLFGVMATTGLPLPDVPLSYWPWIVLGAFAQITATALMLMAMTERSFVVAVAYIKTEPVQVALFGLIFLGDKLTAGMAIAIVIATVGVIVMSLKPGVGTNSRATLLGIGAGGVFALSAVGYRGAVLALHDSNFIMAATFTLVTGLIMQSAMLSLYLAIRDVEVLRAIVRAWKPSVLAGFMGALASEFWFLALAIATAASVRTLALVEVLFAQAISKFIFKQPTTLREAIGIVMIVIGVALLVWTH